MGELFLSFVVTGTPRSKQSFRYTKDGRGYIPAVTKTWQDQVGWEAKIAMQGKSPHQGPVAVDLLFVIPGTKQKIDLDNLSKNVLDGMKNVVYGDDNQVFRLVIEKRYTKDKNEVPPGVHVIVRNLVDIWTSAS